MTYIADRGVWERVSPSYFAVLAAALLCGYALFGRGFAYAGVPPIFAGEIGLFFATLTVVYRFHPGLLTSPITWLLAAFMAWGAIRTLPYIPEFGLAALRDGVIWGYALYGFAVACVLLRFGLIERAIFLYGRWIRVFLLVAPALLVIDWYAEDAIPRWPWGPGGGVPLIDVKTGDFAVHYAGAFAFMALGLSEKPFELRWKLLWLAGAAPLLLMGRGAFLTIAAAMLMVGLLRPTSKYCALMLLAGLGLAFLYLTGIEIDVGAANKRMFSAEQLGANLTSIFFPEASDSLLQGTARWRQMWWENILNYTFFGEHFWTGKGFGINLADADGFQVFADHSLRSPHNAHMTILARAGVPGFVLWGALQAAFGWKLLINFWRDKRDGHVWVAGVELWTLVYWLAFVTNGTFDVFLEGPQGGIWFWSFFGFGLALIVARSEILKSARNGSSTDGQTHLDYRW